MIAQILTSGSAPAATPSGAAKAPAAAQGFAALMRGQGSALAPQVLAKPEATAETTAGPGAPAQAVETEGPEALMALLGKTIAALHQSAEQVTPKRVLAEFAEALGAPVPEQLGDLEAVAKLGDPALVTALQDKIDGALRLSAGVGQLSVASAAVPVVGRGAVAQNASAGKPEGASAALASGTSTATPEASAVARTSATAATSAIAVTPETPATLATSTVPTTAAVAPLAAAAMPATGAEAPAKTPTATSAMPVPQGGPEAQVSRPQANVEAAASGLQPQAQAEEKTPSTAPAMTMPSGAPQAPVAGQMVGKPGQSSPAAASIAPQSQPAPAAQAAAQIAAATPSGTGQGPATPQMPEAATAAPQVAKAAGQIPTSATKTPAPQPAAAVPPAVHSGVAPTSLPPLTQFAEAPPPPPADASAQPVMAPRPLRGLAGAPQATMAPATSPMALGAKGTAQGGDPRTRANDQSTPGVKLGDVAAALPTGVDALSREAASLAAPQSAPQSEAPRLAPPNPVPAPPPNPAAPPEEQLRQHVAQQIRGLETADNKLRFALSPYGMGEIEIEVVRLESGRMQIAMTTESAAVLNMLRQDREQLLEALQSRGLDADSADLDFQTFDDRGRGGGRERFAPELSRAEAGALPEDPASDSAQDGTPAPRMTSGPGQLDILT